MWSFARGFTFLPADGFICPGPVSTGDKNLEDRSVEETGTGSKSAPQSQANVGVGNSSKSAVESSGVQPLPRNCYPKGWEKYLLDEEFDEAGCTKPSEPSGNVPKVKHDFMAGLHENTPKKKRPEIELPSAHRTTGTHRRLSSILPTENKEFFIRPDMRTVLSQLFPVVPELQEQISENNYVRLFHTLLYCEEFATEVAEGRIVEQQASLAPVSGYAWYFLVEPRGNIDKSRIDSDLIIIAKDPTWFGRGYFHAGIVEVPDDVTEIKRGKFTPRCLKIIDAPSNFAELLQDKRKNSFEIRRAPMRYRFRYMHNAVRHSACLKQLLFPTQLPPSRLFLQPESSGKLEISKSLRTEQATALRNMVENKAPGFPYILTGPTGTGKSTILLHLIHHLLTKDSGSRVVFCTKRPRALYNFVTRWMKHQFQTPRESFNDSASFIVLLGTFETTANAAPDTIKPAMFALRDVSNDNLWSRLIFATTEALGDWMTSSVHASRADHISHLLVDDCQEMTEPEALMALSVFRNWSTKSHVILAGDDKLPGPVVLSDLAKEKLSVSLFSRLLASPLYVNRQPALVSTLSKNFRSFPVLMRSSQLLLYPDMRFARNGFDMANDRVIFVPVESAFEPSPLGGWNSNEVRAVKKELEKIPESLKSDIGVVSSFYRQNQEIAQIVGHQVAKIGIPHDFLGCDNRLIIVSLVEPFRGDERSGGYSLLNNVNLANLVASRAKDKLIIIGDPAVFKQDPYWSKLS